MNEIHFLQMYAALQRIKAYQTPERLRKRSGKDWGLDDGNEAVEMAYENVLQEAKNGLLGVRLPKKKTAEPTASSSPPEGKST
jgi:hypothetical protein